MALRRRYHQQVATEAGVQHFPLYYRKTVVLLVITAGACSQPAWATADGVLPPCLWAQGYTGAPLAASFCIPALQFQNCRKHSKYQGNVYCLASSCCRGVHAARAAQRRTMHQPPAARSSAYLTVALGWMMHARRTILFTFTTSVALESRYMGRSSTWYSLGHNLPVTNSRAVLLSHATPFSTSGS